MDSYRSMRASDRVVQGWDGDRFLKILDGIMDFSAIDSVAL